MVQLVQVVKKVTLAVSDKTSRIVQTVCPESKFSRFEKFSLNTITDYQIRYCLQEGRYFENYFSKLLNL